MAQIGTAELGHYQARQRLITRMWPKTPVSRNGLDPQFANGRNVVVHN